MSADKYLSYTYLIGWSKLDLWYYGVRYAQTNRKKDYDLWIDYHTTSNPVKQTRVFIGEPDVIHYDKIFDSVDEAKDYELKVLKEHNCKNSIRWLNKHDNHAPPNTNGKNNPFYGRKHTKEQKEKWRNDKKGVNGPMYGVPAPNRKKIKINNIIYNSITEAAIYYNVTRPCIHYWIKQGKAEIII